jgi:hypothetical protein
MDYSIAGFGLAELIDDHFRYRIRHGIVANRYPASDKRHYVAVEKSFF